MDVSPRKFIQHGQNILQRWLRSITEERVLFDIVAGMTLILVLLYAGGPWYMFIGSKILCILAIIFRPFSRKAILWLALASILALGYASSWYSIDNHKYLITYWCLAVGCSLLTANSLRSLALNARLLIGLAFFFATFWKIISVDYLTGSFFHNYLLIDERFSGLTEYLGGMESEALNRNSQEVAYTIQYRDPLESVSLIDGAGVARLAQFMTWWTILIEGLIAVCFLSPKRLFFSKWRDAILLLFMLTVYPVAPVVGFGWVLTAMGVAQSNQKLFRYWPILYVSAFLIILASTRFPFRTALRLLPFF